MVGQLQIGQRTKGVSDDSASVRCNFIAGCANYALKATADMFEKDCGKLAADFVRSNFYVDDGLKSVATPAEALQLVESSRNMCKKGGFNLHKYMCNSKEVLAAISPELRAKDAQNLDLTCDSLPIERTLGLQWCIESDTFQFRIEVKDIPLTRRGILSTISSVFDPLGLVSPYVLMGKQILQELVRDSGEWDDPIPDEMKARWERWRGELTYLADIHIPRCYKDKDVDTPINVELYNFSDASLTGYGQCSYLRLMDSHDNISCGLVMGKSRVGPRFVTIPRLELTAAELSVKVGNFLQKELDLTRFNKIAIQDKGPDGKWTRKPLAYRESNNVHLLIARPPEICVNLVFKHIHAASSYTICRQFVPFIYCPL